MTEVLVSDERVSGTRVRTLVWRAGVALAGALWMGGLTFYAAFVIHPAAGVLGSESTVGFITERATNWANVVAAVALPMLLVDLVRSRPEGRLRRWSLGLWLFITGLQMGMTGLHPFMDAMLNPAEFAILEPEKFYWFHKAYLWMASVQILTFPVYGYCVVALWNWADGKRKWGG